ISAAIPHALDAVCLKAMAATPEDRYASAQDLAADVERWLADEPVSVGREPLPVRARRWVKRHRTLATAVAAAGVVGATVLTVYSARIARKNHELTELHAKEQTARQTAERHLDRNWKSLRGMVGFTVLSPQH